MSKLKIEQQKELGTNEMVYTLRIPLSDISNAHLGNFDRALLDDIEHGEPSNTPVADILLGLETLVRAIEYERNA